MSATVTIDKAGRIVIPKNVRDRLQIRPGDKLDLSITEDNITLSPEQEEAVMVLKNGFWVFQGGSDQVKGINVLELIDEGRAERDRSILGLE